MEFTTTPTEVIDEDPIDFTVDGDTYTAVRPTPAQMMMVVIDWQHGEEERAAAVVATFEAIVTPSAPLMARLYDRTDPFDLADVWRIVLRHSFATALLQAGTPVQVVADQLGHSSSVITLTTYSHALPTARKAASDLAASLFG